MRVSGQHTCGRGHDPVARWDAVTDERPAGTQVREVDRVKVGTRPEADASKGEVRRPALAGGLAGAVALATTTVVDALSESVPSLIAVVGQAVIRQTPGFLSRGATESVGTADKPLLLALIVVLALGFAARVGVAARRRRRTGDVVFVAFGLFAVVCAASLNTVSVSATLVSAIIGATAGALSLRRLLAANVAAPEAGPAVTGPAVTDPPVTDPPAPPRSPIRRPPAAGRLRSGRGRRPSAAGASWSRDRPPPVGRRC